MKNIAIAFVALFLIFSCTPMKKSGVMSNSSQPSLIGSSWKLADKVSGKIPTLIFDENQVSGNSGCNNYFGKAEMTTSGKITFNNLGTTKMMCPNMDAENNFMSFLPKVNKYNVTENTLELYQNKLLLMKFTKMK